MILSKHIVHIKTLAFRQPSVGLPHSLTSLFFNERLLSFHGKCTLVTQTGRRIWLVVKNAASESSLTPRHWAKVQQEVGCRRSIENCSSPPYCSRLNRARLLALFIITAIDLLYCDLKMRFCSIVFSSRCYDDWLPHGRACAALTYRCWLTEREASAGAVPSVAAAEMRSGHCMLLLECEVTVPIMSATDRHVHMMNTRAARDFWRWN